MVVEALLARWGYLAVGLGTFVEGEAILIAAGALAHKGLLSLPLVMLAAFAGSVAGDQLWFHAGRRVGRPLLDKHPGWSARAAAVQARLERHGDAFVFGFRFLYGLRTVTPVLLGVSAYPARRFAALNVAGGAVWAAAIGGAGWALGAALTRILRRAAHLEELLLAAIALAALLWLVARRVRGAGPPHPAP